MTTTQRIMVAAAIIVFVAWVVILVALGIGKTAEHNATVSDLKWSVKTCEYGYAMYRVGAGTEPMDAVIDAQRGCADSLAKLGVRAFIEEYKPEQ